MIEENTKNEETATASLSQRAVACKHWRVLPGMRVLLEFTAGVFVWVRPRDQAEVDDLGAITRMDLDDPATIGCLLALVRLAWGGRRVWVMQIGGHWRVGDSLGWVGPTCDTEAEALVAALEAAP